MSHLDEVELLELRATTHEDRLRLARVIDGVTRLERLAALRVFTVGVLAFLSVPLWIQAAFPRLMPGPALYFIAAWVPAALGLMAILVADRIIRRRARRLADCTTAGSVDVQDATRSPR